MTYFPASPVYAAIKNTVSRLEIACHPLQGTMDYPDPKGLEEAKNPLDRDLARLVMSGPDSLEDKEKWQLLSRELA